ncbi:hypothetical protein OAT18_00210 [Tenacibaculum sp.]|nr:hypothetical protein [Tenacibaculum sp.]
MSRNKYFIFVTVFFLIFSCKETKEKKNLKYNVKIERDSIELIIEKSINTKKIDFYNNVLMSKDLYIVVDSLIGVRRDIKVSRNNQKVKILSLKEVKKESSLNYFKFKKINFNKGKCYVVFYHKYENFDCEITFHKKGEKWREKNVLIVQY